MPARTAAIQALNQRLRAGLAHFPEVVLNSPASAVPEVVNFSENCIKSETMLAFLAERKIYVSSASACGRGQPSHTLAAMGLPPAPLTPPSVCPSVPTTPLRMWMPSWSVSRTA